MRIIKIANSEISQLMEKWKSRGVELFIYEGKDYLKLMEIVVPKSDRKQGIGSEIMNEIVELSDKLGKRLLLTPDTSYGGSSEARLRRFYKRFGLLDNRGRSKDYSISDSMYRNPSDSMYRNPSDSSDLEEGL